MGHVVTMNLKMNLIIKYEWNGSIGFGLGFILPTVNVPFAKVGAHK